MSKLLIRLISSSSLTQHLGRNCYYQQHCHLATAAFVKQFSLYSTQTQPFHPEDVFKQVLQLFTKVSIVLAVL